MDIKKREGKKEKKTKREREREIKTLDITFK